VTSPARIIDRSCGPSGCEVDWLSSERHEAPEGVTAFTRWAAERGWGDGLPLIPPTEGRVRAFLALCDRFPDEIVAELPPLRGECTVEKIAINAVMAGADPAAMPLIIAAIEAMSRTEFNLAALNATTGSVVPAVIVNGPVRDELAIPYEVSCLGGAGGGAPAIGRAIRLVMRNLAGQAAGVTSQSVFGTPGRLAGIVFGEWEEQSPWAPLAERRGVAGNAPHALEHPVDELDALGASPVPEVEPREDHRLVVAPVVVRHHRRGRDRDRGPARVVDRVQCRLDARVPRRTEVLGDHVGLEHECIGATMLTRYPPLRNSF